MDGVRSGGLIPGGEGLGLGLVGVEMEMGADVDGVLG